MTLKRTQIFQVYFGILFLSLIQCRQTILVTDSNIASISSNPFSNAANAAKNKTSVNPSNQKGIEIKGIKACEYFWEEKQGYCDYTLYDASTRQNYPNPDRTQDKTLQGSGVLKANDICDNVPKLLPCFKKAWANDTDHHKNLEKLFKDKNISPIQLMFALAWQETRQGEIPDHCSGSSCNGIGLKQVITVVSDDFSESISGNQKQWPGITHNLLTNLKYGLRILDSKVKIAYAKGTPSLEYVAQIYNGSATQLEYLELVKQHYEKLKKCGVNYDN